MQFLRKKIHAGNSDAVQPSGDLVSVGVKLSAGVQFRHHHFGGRLSLFLHFIDRDPAAVIDYRDRIVQMDRDFDGVAISSQCLIDRVVHHFIDQVMQAQLAGRADIHSRPLAHGLPAFKNRDR